MIRVPLQDPLLLSHGVSITAFVVADGAGGRLSSAMDREAEAYWRASRGPLPGSARTARLRKKRRSMVWAWFDAQHAA